MAIADRRLRRLLRAPWLHFLLLGGLLHLGQGLLPSAAAALPTGAADVERLRREWRAETGRWPSHAELLASTERWLDEQALLAEALHRELDLRDSVARERLLANLRFARPELGDDEAALLAEARRLGMPASDLVVRRRLVQRLEQELSAGQTVDEAALRAYVAAHPERYGQPERLRFSQLYLNRDRPGRSADQAEQLLARLRAEPGLDPATLGDAWLFDGDAVPQSLAQLRQRYGAGLAAALQTAPAGAWVGPVETVYGWHLLQLQERLPAQAPDYPAVRQRAAYAWLAEQEPAWRRARLDGWRRDQGLPSASALLAEAGR
ncbi:peptidyl-prolyl cis-trans isomerase [Stagnimonas aquatica]|uniref:peptidylprolyl isomerase n=1 Tax=Stagnimonas aquatica TaxID=2689987 RepID=A0A3N0VHB9_9GAMM|nr:peptidylprolyl isomerase [Stagnimonas aquatica]ROH92105.1 peptidyl-prolyl cis-trans isomerase [Stagnimonas aquatica]